MKYRSRLVKFWPLQRWKWNVRIMASILPAKRGADGTRRVSRIETIPLILKAEASPTHAMLSDQWMSSLVVETYCSCVCYVGGQWILWSHLALIWNASNNDYFQLNLAPHSPLKHRIVFYENSMIWSNEANPAGKLQQVTSYIDLTNNSDDDDDNTAVSPLFLSYHRDLGPFHTLLKVRLTVKN